MPITAMPVASARQRIARSWVSRLQKAQPPPWMYRIAPRAEAGRNSRAGRWAPPPGSVSSAVSIGGRSRFQRMLPASACARPSAAGSVIGSGRCPSSAASRAMIAAISGFGASFGSKPVMPCGPPRPVPKIDGPTSTMVSM